MVGASRTPLRITPTLTLAATLVSWLAGSHPARGLVLSTGSGAPRFTHVRLALPSGLTLASARWVELQLHARTTPRPRFSAHVRHGALEITLWRPLAELRLALAYPDLRVDDRRQAQAPHGGGGGSKLNLRIIDTDAGTTVVRARLTPGP